MTAISVDTERATDLDDVMDRMIARDDDYRYSVAWIDSVHPSGRGVLTRGGHAPAEWLPEKEQADALAYAPKALATAPAFIPGGLVNPVTMRAFNEAWFRKAPASRQGELQAIGEFFHPLDIVQDWNRVYGPAGFLSTTVRRARRGHLVAPLQRFRAARALSSPPRLGGAARIPRHCRSCSRRTRRPAFPRPGRGVGRTRPAGAGRGGRLPREVTPGCRRSSWRRPTRAWASGARARSDGSRDLHSDPPEGCHCEEQAIVMDALGELQSVLVSAAPAIARDGPGTAAGTPAPVVLAGRPSTADDAAAALAARHGGVSTVAFDAIGR
jgi:hypothetical protein